MYATDNPNDNFGMIHEGLLKSLQFQNLSSGAQNFLLTCYVHAQTEKSRRCLYNHGKEFSREYDHERDFVFPRKQMEEYGVDGSNGYKYLKALIDAGFLEIKEQNKHMRMVNVYSFSSKWRERQRDQEETS